MPTATGKTQALARYALGEAAYDAAASRGAAMDDNEVVRYAVSEFQRVATLLARPGVPLSSTRLASPPRLQIGLQFNSMRHSPAWSG
jgi:hypothetical protein